jgi:hypothetical protein
LEVVLFGIGAKLRTTKIYLLFFPLILSCDTEISKRSQPSQRDQDQVPEKNVSQTNNPSVADGLIAVESPPNGEPKTTIEKLSCALNAFAEARNIASHRTESISIAKPLNRTT